MTTDDSKQEQKPSSIRNCKELVASQSDWWARTPCKHRGREAGDMNFPCWHRGASTPTVPKTFCGLKPKQSLFIIYYIYYEIVHEVQHKIGDRRILWVGTQALNST